MAEQGLAEDAGQKAELGEAPELAVL